MPTAAARVETTIEPLVLNINETAKAMRIGRESVRLLVLSGELAAARVGPGKGRIVIPLESIRAYLARHTSQQAATT